MNGIQSKARENLAKHGVHFAEAVAVLEDDLALTIQDPFSEDEERWIHFGQERGWSNFGSRLCLARGQREVDFGSRSYPEGEESIRGTS